MANKKRKPRWLSVPARQGSPSTSEPCGTVQPPRTRGWPSPTRRVLTIKDVPPGKYTLWLKHPDTDLEDRMQVEVKANHKAEVTFEWKEAKPKT
jgi:hypothetical protein